MHVKRIDGMMKGENKIADNFEYLSNHQARNMIQ
jgi:hypothetical protein